MRYQVERETLQGKGVDKAVKGNWGHGMQQQKMTPLAGHFAYELGNRDPSELQ